MFVFLIVITTLLLLIGSTRRRILAAWRLIVPLAIGGMVGLPVARMLVNSGAPPWMMIVGPICAAFMIGGALNQGLDEILGPSKKKRD